jgi:ParB family transcriptional regulator, chromosome partitioning protein
MKLKLRRAAANRGREMTATNALEKNPSEKHLPEKKDDRPEKRRALGRGLDSLLPGPRVVPPTPETRTAPAESAAEAPAAAPTQAPAPSVISIQAQAQDPHEGPHEDPHDVVTYIPLDAIEKNPYQTRTIFEEQSLIELRDSIKEHGVVQPVVVRPAEEQGRYILVLGERRLRASRMAGKETIPALVRRLSLQQAAEMTVLENVLREDLTCIEQAQAFKVLSQNFLLTQVQIADRIGVSRETVSNYMRLLRLPEKVMEYLRTEQLTFSNARLLLMLDDNDQIERLATDAVSRRMSWREIEERVLQVPDSASSAETPQQAQSRGARWVDPNVRAAQTEMERILGVRVSIKDRQGKGKIIIEYSTVDDYERVVEMLRGSKSA